MLHRPIVRSIEWVCPLDDALSDDADYNAYAASQFRDESPLSFKPGERPTRFTLRQLRYRHRLAVADEVTEGQRVDLAVRCSLVAVRDFGDTLPEMQREGDDPSRPLTSQWMEQAALPYPVLRMMEIAIIAISDLTAPLPKRSDTAAGGTERAKREPASAGA